MIPTDPYKTYKTKKGNTYRVTGVGKLEGSGKWIDRKPKWHWVVNVLFEDGSRYDWYFDYNDKFYDYDRTN